MFLHTQVSIRFKNLFKLIDRTSGNAWSSGPAPPPPPGTPPATRRNRNHKSGGSNTSSDDGSGEGGKKSGIGGGAIAGIVISILVVGAIVAFFLVKRKSRKLSSDIEKLDNQPFVAPLNSSEVQGTLQTFFILHAFEEFFSLLSWGGHIYFMPCIL